MLSKEKKHTTQERYLYNRASLRFDIENILNLCSDHFAATSCQHGVVKLLSLHFFKRKITRYTDEIVAIAIKIN